ncbi:uncharacterized protein LOC131624793 [Vicia villosa]|uniref:uncharacterized protein LOC131624793 n=1 Tax=Vicia villosa TaxID=3911 RepID=UPI00273BDAE2|nr:uncharacterized protein LOC131624793 [Vicia villosa]
MRLNPEKYTFGVQAGKFLGLMLTNRGIEENSDKCQAVLDMRSPTSKTEVQQLTGRLAALSRILSCADDKAIHFFATIHKAEEFEWTPACEEAFLAVKYFLSSPPILTKPKENSPLVLYLALTDNAMSSILVQDGAEGRDPCTTSVRTSIKSRALADFVVELSTPGSSEDIPGWVLHVDGSSNLKGSGAGIVLEGPRDFILEYSLCFKFKASNNQAEYEALIAGMRLAEEVGVTHLTVKTDSQLVASQVKGEYQTKYDSLPKYLARTHELAQRFTEFIIVHIPREENVRADIFARLESTKAPGLNKMVIQEVIEKPSIERQEVMPVEQQEGWMTPIIQYLTSGDLPGDPDQALRIRKTAVWYTIVGGKLYRMGRSSPMLRCVAEEDVKLIMMEVHEGACGSHIAGRSLASKIL